MLNACFIFVMKSKISTYCRLKFKDFQVLSSTFPVFKHFQGPWIFYPKFKHFQGFLKHAMNPERKSIPHIATIYFQLNFPDSISIVLLHFAGWKVKV